MNEIKIFCENHTRVVRVNYKFKPDTPYIKQLEPKALSYTFKNKLFILKTKR